MFLENISTDTCQKKAAMALVTLPFQGEGVKPVTCAE